MEEDLLRASELFERARRLDKEQRMVFDYFYKNVSVGDLRALMELEKLGVRDPQARIDELVEMGLLEKGMDCYNLAKPLREYIFKRGR
ncbi:MAG: hypothetical protein F7C33_01835 [Desulfurococcales archaeon]|nr:hypothetical protein [Desulfurococcales archaeon]